MRRQEIDLVLDFLSFVVAVFVCLFFTGLSEIFASSEIQERVYRDSFTFAIFSFGIFYLFFLNIKYLLSFKFSLPNWSHGFVWLFTIISGVGLFTHFTDSSPYFSWNALFLRFFLLTILTLIPAAIFRWSAAIVISYWQPKKLSSSIEE